MGGSESTEVPKNVVIENPDTIEMVPGVSVSTDIVRDAVVAKYGSNKDAQSKESDQQSNSSSPSKSESAHSPKYPDIEIEKIQQTYSERIRKLEEQQKSLHRDRTKEFERAVSDAETLFLKTHMSPICPTQQESLMQCLDSVKPNRVLECSNLVQAYKKCVEKTRQHLIVKGNTQ